MLSLMEGVEPSMLVVNSITVYTELSSHTFFSGNGHHSSGFPTVLQTHEF